MTESSSEKKEKKKKIPPSLAAQNQAKVDLGGNQGLSEGAIQRLHEGYNIAGLEDSIQIRGEIKSGKTTKGKHVGS